MVALTGYFNFFGARVLTGWATVFVASLYRALAWQVCALPLLNCRHHECSFSYGNRDLNSVVREAIPGGLPSFRHPANQCSGGDSNHKRRRHREHNVAL